MGDEPTSPTFDVRFFQQAALTTAPGDRHCTRLYIDRGHFYVGVYKKDNLMRLGNNTYYVLGDIVSGGNCVDKISGMSWFFHH